MSQAKGTPALTELDGGGPAMPSWGRRASGSCQLLHRNSGSPGRADPARCPPQGCLCLLDIRCPESQRWSGGTSALPCLAGCPLSHPSPMSPGALVPAVPHSTGVCRPHLAPPQEPWMGAGTQPLCCHEAFSGFPCAGCNTRRSWASSELSRGSCPGASSIPPAARRALDPLRARGPVLQRGSWCCSGGPGAAAGIPVLQHPRASAWLQPGGAASPVPRVCLELSPRQPSVALSSINLILPVLHSCFFFF